MLLLNLKIDRLINTTGNFILMFASNALSKNSSPSKTKFNFMRFISHINGCCCSKKVGQLQESIKEEIIIQEDYLRTIYDIMLGALGEDSGAPEFEVFSLGMTQVDIDYVLQNLESRKDDPITVFNELGFRGNSTVRSLFESTEGKPMPTPIVVYQNSVLNRFYMLVEYGGQLVEYEGVPIRSVYIIPANANA